MVAIGRYANLPMMLLVTGLPLFILGTLLSTYLGLMITRGLRWSESVLAIAVMLALMAVAVLAARDTDGLLTVSCWNLRWRSIALTLRFVARGRWAHIDWLQCRWTARCLADPPREASRRHRVPRRRGPGIRWVADRLFETPLPAGR